MNYAVAWSAPKRAFGVLVATNIRAETTAKAADEAVAALIEHHLRKKP